MSYKTDEPKSNLSQFGCIQDFEKHASKTLPKPIQDYYSAGEGDEFTVKWNRDAFKKYRICPRVLRNVSKRDLTTTVLGETVSMPVGVSPTGFQKMAHPDGECGNAKAAKAANTVFILSLYSTTGIDDVAKSTPDSLKWLQLVIFKDRDITLDIVRKAEIAGFKALVVIVDNPVYGKSKANTMITCMENYISTVSILEECKSLKNSLRSMSAQKKLEYMSNMLDASLTWEDISWLKSVTELPIVLKGILTPEDALLGVKHGANAIFVSNHGGRQLDDEPATIEVLPSIVKAVGNTAEVYVDGGITKGVDAYKALALGARMVFLGKSMLWGLACGGEEGALAVLEIMRKELDHVLAVTGCSRLEQVTERMVAHETSFKC